MVRTFQRLMWSTFLLGGLLAAVPPARAGSYIVNTCRTAEPTGWTAFADHGWPVFFTDWQCAPVIEGEPAGLGAATVVAYTNPQLVSLHSAVGWRFTAPAGKKIVRLSADANVQSTRGMFTAEVWNPVTGDSLGRPTSRADQYDPFSLPGVSVDAIAVGMRCKQPAGCRMSGPDPTAGTADQQIKLRNLRVYIGDDQAPTISVVRGAGDRWITESEVPIEAALRDDTGVVYAEARVGEALAGLTDTACYEAAHNIDPLPCASSNRSVKGVLDAKTLRNGEHALTIRAYDAADNVATYSTTVLVDRSSPLTPQRLTLAGEQGWRSTNRFDVSWASPQDEGPSGVAGAEYLLCPATNAPYEEVGCVREQSERAGISSGTVSVPHDGAWSLRVTLRDAAGNFDAGRSATLEPLRLDSAAPFGEFVPFDPRDPTRVRVHVGDTLSGVARVEVEARREGDSSWRSLEAEAQSGGLYAASLDDSALPAGTYELRARVHDQAGNERTISGLRGGQSLRLALPVRAASTVQVGEPSRVRVKSSRRGRPRYRRVLIERPTPRYGASVSLEGRLADPAGNPRADAPIEIFERIDAPGREYQYVATVRTNGKGVFTFKALPGPARRLRFGYPGSPMTQPGSDEVELRVRAAVTIKPSRRKLRNGSSVLFSGRLVSGPVPEAGKIMALQALTSQGWRTFATPRARAVDGRWRHRYRFTGTGYRTRYAFRVIVPSESGYPYAAGNSPTTHVLVNP